MVLSIHVASQTDLQSSVMGGSLMAVSASSFMLLTGRITGISGILRNFLNPTAPENSDFWPHAYLLGLISSGVISSGLFSKSFGNPSQLSPLTLLVSGLLVGFGTSLSNGCTSGHGFCGLPRLSIRSAAAVATFMVTGIISSTLSRIVRIDALFSSLSPAILDRLLRKLSLLPLLSIILFSRTFFRKSSPLSAFQARIKVEDKWRVITDYVVTYLCGFGFGWGLYFSGMCNSDKVHMFLDLFGPRGWDPSLAGVMGSGVVINYFSFQALKKSSIKISTSSKDILVSSKLKIGNIPENKVIDSALIIGSVLFGLGWGLSGICPGPSLVLLGANKLSALTQVPAVLAGILLHQSLTN